MSFALGLCVGIAFWVMILVFRVDRLADRVRKLEEGVRCMCGGRMER